MKKEHMLAGARALEKGLQVVDLDSIEEMVFGLLSLIPSRLCIVAERNEML